jgi:hypothetical protein
MVTRRRPALAFARRLRHKAGMVERGKSVQERLRALQGQLRKMLPLVEGLLEAGEVREPEASYRASQEEHAARPAESRYRIQRYGRRNYALYDGEDLVAVMAYKRGAMEVKGRFEALEREIARLKQGLSETGTEPPGRAGRTGAVQRLQAEREAGNVRER